MKNRIAVGLIVLASAAIMMSCGGGSGSAKGTSPPARGSTPSVGAPQSAGTSATSGSPGNGTAAAGGTAVAVPSRFVPSPNPNATPVPTIDPAIRPKSTMAIDANASTPGVENTVTVPVGSDFKIAIVLTSASAGYVGYQFDMKWDPAVVSYVAVDHLHPENLTLCSPTRAIGSSRVAAFCFKQDLVTTTYTGPLSTVTLHCATAGNSVLHLLSPQDGEPGTKVEGVGLPNEHIVTRVDATVTCQ